MSSALDDPLTAGREAAARGAWREAYDLLSPVAGDLEPEDLESLADAAWWSGKLDEAIALREQAHAGWLARGEPKRAALLALTLSQDYFGKAALAPSQGWFAKAERLLKDEPEGLEHGYLALTQALNAMAASETETAIDRGTRAYDLGVEHGDRDLQALALVALGRANLLAKNTDEGLRLLDEASTAAVCGELQPISTGMVYCITITSCNGVGDLRRASEWTDAAHRWCQKQDLSGFPGACRIHHSSLLRLKGDWAEAEAQALQACEELHGFDAWTTAIGWYEVGEIRRIRGDFAAAEDAYRMAKEWARDPEPGLSLLRLAQGKAEAAAKAIERSLAATKDDVARLRRLPAQVEIALALQDFKTARSAAEELERLADEYRVAGERTPAFEAMVCLSWGRIRLTENDDAGAAEHLTRALETWQGVGAPYEAAQVRMLLGRALARLGDEDGALEEFRAARAVFERLGAVLDVQRTEELLGERTARRTFFFSDIVDSTKLGEALGEGKWKKLLTWHDRTLEELISGSGGDVIKHTGDGYFAAFASAHAAIEAAVAIQRALDEHEPLAPDVRIGIHSGGSFHHGDDDYAGEGVNVAARVGAVAGGGEILVSRASLDGEAAPYALSSPRTLELKGVSEPVELVAVEWR